MLTDLENAQLTELLSQLDREDIASLVKTVTNTLLTPENREEAVSIILQYSPSVSSVLSRKKITKEVVFRYLHKKKVAGVDPNMTKTRMVQRMVMFWEKAAKKEKAPKRQHNTKEEEKDENFEITVKKEKSQHLVDVESDKDAAVTRPKSAPGSPSRKVAILKKPGSVAESREDAAASTKQLPGTPSRKVTILKETEGGVIAAVPVKRPAPGSPSKIVTVLKKTDKGRENCPSATKDCDSKLPDKQLVEIKNEDEVEEDAEAVLMDQSQLCLSNEFNLQLFSETFTKWFYNLLNIGESTCGQKFGPEHFWPDNILQIKVTGPNLNVHEERFTGHESASLLAQMRSHFDLYLNPNISNDGILAQRESHGLIRITVCGTAHKRDLCVGFFEQSFLIIKDPMMENNWRIKKTEIQMKTTIDGKSGQAETSAMSLIPLLQ